MSPRQRPRLPQHHREQPAQETAPGEQEHLTAEARRAEAEGASSPERVEPEPAAEQPRRTVRVNDSRKVRPYSGPDPAAADSLAPEAGQSGPVADGAGSADAALSSGRTAAAEDPAGPGPSEETGAAGAPGREGSSSAAGARAAGGDRRGRFPFRGRASGRRRSSRAPGPHREPGEEGTNVVAFSAHQDQRRRATGRRRLRRLALGAGVLVLVAALFLGVVFFSPLLAVRTITVEGTRLTDRSAIEKSLRDLDGVPLTRVSEQEVQERIGKDARIRSVSVEARPPHELVVQVKERVPVATVKDGDQYLLVDRDGVRVGSAHSQADAGVPLIDGGTAALDSAGFSSAVQVLETVPQSLLAQMDHADADSAADISLHLENGITVKWGTSKDSEYKAQVLQSLVKALGEQAQYSTIDVSSPDHPVTK